MSLFDLSAKSVTQQLSDRTCRVAVEADGTGLPQTPILLLAEVHFDDGLTIAQVALSVQNAKLLRAALLVAIKETERTKGSKA